MITWENYEEYMVMHADGELTPVQEQELMSFLYEHPELQSELTAFTMTKMIPDAEETYAHKASLLKPLPAAAPAEKPRVIALPIWRRYAVAAGVAAILFASGYSIYTATNNDHDNNNTSPIAATIPQPANTAPIDPTPAPQQIITTPPPAATIQPQPQQAVAVRKVKNNAPIAPERYNTPKNALAQTPAHVQYAYARTAIEHMPTAEAKELNAEQKNIAAVVTNVPPLAIQYREDDTEDATGNFIDMLPVADTKKAGMKTIASNAAAQYDLVTSIKQEIENANVSVSIKNKKLIFSF